MDMKAETAFAFMLLHHKKKGMEKMHTLEKEVKRLEMQIGQLVSIIANLNDRLNRLEDSERKKKIRSIRKIQLAERI
jgi:predicted RNase H-like nuclease (RuvC/YqgF family)